MLLNGKELSIGTTVRIAAAHPSDFLAMRVGKIEGFLYASDEDVYADLYLVNGDDNPRMMVHPQFLTVLEPDAVERFWYVVLNEEMPANQAWHAARQESLRAKVALEEALHGAGFYTKPLMERVWVSPNLAYVLAIEEDKASRLSAATLAELSSLYMDLKKASIRLASEEARIID